MDGLGCLWESSERLSCKVVVEFVNGIRVRLGARKGIVDDGGRWRGRSIGNGMEITVRMSMGMDVISKLYYER